MKKPNEKNTQKNDNEPTPQPQQQGESQPSCQGQQPAPQQQPQQAKHATPQQQAQAIPSMDEIKGKWKQHVGAAKVAWGKLTEDELLESDGREQKLAGLVQERYALSREEASKQVKDFLEKCKR